MEVSASEKNKHNLLNKIYKSSTNIYFVRVQMDYRRCFNRICGFYLDLYFYILVLLETKETT